MGFLGELKRRNVVRVAVLYLIASWVILQVADVLIAVLLDSRSNRYAVAGARRMFEDAFEIDPPEARAALSAGRLPERDVLLFVRPQRSRRSRGVSRAT